MTELTPRASVVICTRNRGDSVVATLKSVLANTYPCFEVLLVDQSTNRDSEISISPFRDDPRFRYIHSNTKGLSIARNIGVSEALSQIVIMTDDDCTVPDNWIEKMASIFDQHGRVAVAFCNLVAGPYDQSAGFIPNYARRESKLVRTLWEKRNARGYGAGMAVRREPILGLGGFDPHLGAGAKFSASEDYDIAVRALLHGFWVYETHEVAVVHHGFRTWQQGKELANRDGLGLGAAYIKPLKCGHGRIIPLLLHEVVLLAVIEPVSTLIRSGRPRGFRRIYYFVQGVIRGLRTTVNCRGIMYDEGPRRQARS